MRTASELAHAPQMSDAHEGRGPAKILNAVKQLDVIIVLDTELDVYIGAVQLFDGLAVYWLFVLFFFFG
jgi:hypothetical protein